MQGCSFITRPSVCRITASAGLIPHTENGFSFFLLFSCAVKISFSKCDMMVNNEIAVFVRLTSWFFCPTQTPYFQLLHGAVFFHFHSHCGFPEHGMCILVSNTNVPRD